MQFSHLGGDCLGQFGVGMSQGAGCDSGYEICRKGRVELEDVRVVKNRRYTHHMQKRVLVVVATSQQIIFNRHTLTS